MKQGQLPDAVPERVGAGATTADVRQRNGNVEILRVRKKAVAR
jgi:hypothetical protein